MRRARAALVPAILALTLAACGDPPSAFGPREPFANPLLDPGLRGGVVVRPIEGAGDEAAEALAGAVIESLRQADIPALSPADAAPSATSATGEVGAAASAANHYALQGRVRQAPPEGPLLIEWRLSDEQGAEVTRFVSDHRATATDWAEARPALRASVAEAATRALNRYLDESEGLPPEIGTLPPVSIAGIDGARGAGPQALRRSLEHHLEKAGLTVEHTVSDKGALILGALETAPSTGRPGGPPVETLRVTWTLMRPDGREIGVLRQANDIPRGALARPWGDLAYLIAEAAAPGIVELLQQAAQADAKTDAKAGGATGSGANPGPKRGPIPNQRPSQRPDRAPVPR